MREPAQRGTCCHSAHPTPSPRATGSPAGAGLCGPHPGTASRAPTCSVPVLRVTLGQVLAESPGGSGGGQRGAVRAHGPWPLPRQERGSPPPPGPGHPGGTPPPRARLAGRSSRTRGPSAAWPDPQTRLVSPLPGNPATRAVGRSRRAQGAAGAGSPQGQRAHSPHFGRHGGHGLAPQRPPPGGGGAHGRGAGASPGSERAPRPPPPPGEPGRTGARAGDPHGRAEPSASRTGARGAGSRGQDRGRCSAHRDVRGGAGPGGPCTVAAHLTSGPGVAAPPTVRPPSVRTRAGTCPQGPRSRVRGPPIPTPPRPRRPGPCGSSPGRCSMTRRRSVGARVLGASCVHQWSNAREMGEARPCSGDPRSWAPARLGLELLPRGFKSQQRGVWVGSQAPLGIALPQAPGVRTTGPQDQIYLYSPAKQKHQG